MSPAISKRACRDLLAHVRSVTRYAGNVATNLLRAQAELERAVERKAPSPSKKARESKREAKRDRTAAVRELVMHRARGQCEFCTATSAALELDHFAGRARSESVESCWALCFSCHRAKTNNAPSAAYWLERFISHCERLGNWGEAARARSRLAFVIRKQFGGGR